MKKFTAEQDAAANPPERRGEQTPEETEQRVLERRSGETLLDETVEELEEEETDGVEWDGSEAELVADDDAAEYEEQNTGIALKYTLRRDEIFRVLMKTQYTQARIVLSVIAALLGIVMAVVFFVRAAGGHSEVVPLGITCLVVVFLIIPSPVFGIRNSAKKSADGNEIRMEIYPDHIEMGGTRNSWEIPLDGTAECRALQELIVLYIGNHMVILPLRCVEPAVLPEVQAMIFAGTRPVR
jgi:hypothetical protein